MSSELKDNEIFLYQERCFPITRDPRKNPLETIVYPWRYACTSNKIIKEFPERIGRLLNKDINELIDRLSIIYEKNHPLVILYNPDYSGNFTTDGTHADTWLHQEKGVEEKVARLFAEKLNKKRIESETRIHSISLRYLCSI